MKIVLAILLSILVFGFNISGQKRVKPRKPKFDAKLAKKVGADKYGMKSYVLAILKTGPNDASITGTERAEMFKGHMANINRLAKQKNSLSPARSARTTRRFADCSS